MLYLINEFEVKENLNNKKVLVLKMCEIIEKKNLEKKSNASVNNEKVK